MIKLPYKQHIIGVDGTEKKVEKIVEDLSKHFSKVTSEIVKYDQFANKETKVILKESVRGKYTRIVDDLFGTLYPQFLPSISFNDRLFQSLFLRQ